MCWPISLVAATVEDPMSAHTLLYPGSLRVVYHPELFPAVMRVALDCLCGVRGPVVLTEEPPVEPLELDAVWDEPLERGWLSDSSGGEVASDGTPSSQRSSSASSTLRSAVLRPGCPSSTPASVFPFLPSLLSMLPEVLLCGGTAGRSWEALWAVVWVLVTWGASEGARPSRSDSSLLRPAPVIRDLLSLLVVMGCSPIHV